MSHCQHCCLQAVISYIKMLLFMHHVWHSLSLMWTLYASAGPAYRQIFKYLLPFWTPALPGLPVTAPTWKDGREMLEAEELIDGKRRRRQRSSTFDVRKVILALAIMWVNCSPSHMWWAALVPVFAYSFSFGKYLYMCCNVKWYCKLRKSRFCNFWYQFFAPSNFFSFSYVGSHLFFSSETSNFEQWYQGHIVQKASLPIEQHGWKLRVFWSEAWIAMLAFQMWLGRIS